jgi:hypothetical protein
VVDVPMFGPSQAISRGVASALVGTSLWLIGVCGGGSAATAVAGERKTAPDMSLQYLQSSARALSAAYSVAKAGFDVAEVYAWSEIPATAPGGTDEVGANSVLKRLGAPWRQAQVEPSNAPSSVNGAGAKVVSTMAGSGGQRLRLSVDTLPPSQGSGRYVVAVMWMGRGCNVGTLAGLASDLYRALGPVSPEAKWTQSISGSRKPMVTDRAKGAVADALIRALHGRQDGRWESLHALNASGYAPKLIDALDVTGKSVRFNLSVRDNTSTAETWVSLATPVLLDDD